MSSKKQSFFEQEKQIERPPSENPELYLKIKTFKKLPITAPKAKKKIAKIIFIQCNYYNWFQHSNPSIKQENKKPRNQEIKKTWR